MHVLRNHVRCNNKKPRIFATLAMCMRTCATCPHCLGMFDDKMRVKKVSLDARSGDSTGSSMDPCGISRSPKFSHNPTSLHNRSDADNLYPNPFPRPLKHPHPSQNAGPNFPSDIPLRDRHAQPNVTIAQTRVVCNPPVQEAPQLLHLSLRASRLRKKLRAVSEARSPRTSRFF